RFVLQKLEVERLEEVGAERIALAFRGPAREVTVQMFALHERHGDHAIARQFAHNTRYAHEGQWREHLSKVFDIVRLATIVRLDSDLLLQLVDDELRDVLRQLRGLADRAK